MSLLSKKQVMNLILVVAGCFILIHSASAADSADNRPACWAQPIKLDGVPNLHKLDENLYRSAQPTATGMKNLEQMGIKTVLNLRSFHSDRKAIGNTGLGYEHLYMKAWHPEREDIIRFLRIVTDPERSPLLVHCLHGADRTGTMCAVYRIVVQGWTKEQALREMTEGGFNFHSIFDNLPDWIQKLDVESLRKEAGIDRSVAKEGAQKCICNRTDAEVDRPVSAKITRCSYNQDRAALTRLRGNLFHLAKEIRCRSDLFSPRPETDATLLKPEMRGQILSLWYPLLENYLALDALAEKYVDFHRFENKNARNRAFHLLRGVFLTQYRIALQILPLLEQNPVVDTILNEGDEGMGLPLGGYAQFKYQYLNMVKAGRYAALETVARAFDAPEDTCLQQWAAQDSRVILDAGKGPGPLMTLENGLAIVKDFGHASWLPVQKEVAEWMGHTKVWRPHQYLIRPEQIENLSQNLEPGDILLERREWYLTNVGIPGFWTHAALYIGTPEQRLALSQDPQVKDWLGQMGVQSLDALIRQRYPAAFAGMQQPYQDGHLPQVIEAISAGVSLTSLNYSATCDSLAVLRPRLSKADRAAAVVRAMRYHARPYDYAFDFASDKSLVCTELVVKSYLPGESKQGLDLPLENVMGQMITPANAFVRQFDRSFGTARQQMDLVVFLDGDEKDAVATTSDIAAFRASWRRPKWHVLVQNTKN
ncbi:protein serine/threonine/tyrosine phosphatase, putative [Syntrophotalea carbinolica DSM 2380]|uniref:Protein serine/threonine/tyrosine phosphatase, putative n=1 Tax=Syntrophotalea carbinolica (strain DSM 2380 / NBRC 103641 / GraBd1) TaxID=338963 RepID=Q3A0N1_SYNC1|nr:YiiX/YebB-like N1pC/P60 family cysteine hydrolase [Syntrophotalea carbinolica]ABA90076.2 protein serine/threonine/tyrosine phosphatase, putative [Syntrophotalea carbinolica DSM 2380]